MTAAACAAVAARVWPEVASGLRPLEHALNLSTAAKARQLRRAIRGRIPDALHTTVRRIDVQERGEVAYAVALLETRDGQIRALSMHLIYRHRWWVAGCDLLPAPRRTS